MSPFFCILELTDLLPENVKIHFRRIGTLQVVHESSDLGRSSRCAVHVNDVRSVAQTLSRIILPPLM